MAVVNRFTSSKLRIFTYLKDVTPPVLADVQNLSMALYDPSNNLVYYENNPINVSTGVNDISIPGYALMIPTKEQAPYEALVVATFPDGRMRANIELITVN